MGMSLKTNIRRSIWARGSSSRRMKSRKPLKTKLEGVSPGWTLLLRKNTWGQMDGVRMRRASCLPQDTAIAKGLTVLHKLCPNAPALAAWCRSGHRHGGCSKVPTHWPLWGLLAPHPWLLRSLTLFPVKQRGRGVLVSGKSLSSRGSRFSCMPWQEVMVSRSTRSLSRE